MSVTSNSSAVVDRTTDAPVSATAVEERRGTDRVPGKMPARLIGFGQSDAVQCFAKDISEGGLFVHVPMNSGISVGQRYEIELAGGQEAPDLTASVGEGRYATVVRTERIAQGPEHTVGAGLRFDRPLML